MQFFVNESGIRALATEEVRKFVAELDAEKVEYMRASHVEPTNIFYRWSFHFLRLFGGEYGWPIAYTRRWRCGWRINLAPLGGGIVLDDGRPFYSRQQAIAVEISLVNQLLRRAGC